MGTNTPVTKRYSGARGCFSIIADRSLEAIAVIDTDGLIHYANAAWVRMHGYELRSEVVGRRISDFHNKEQIAGEVLTFLRKLEHCGQISGPVRHIHKDGTEIPTHTSMLALKDETGKQRGVIIFAIDLCKLEQLKKDIGGLKAEVHKQTAEPAPAVDKQLWQLVSQTEQIQKQCTMLRTALADKEKEAAELKRQLQLQKTENIQLEQQWGKKYSEMMHSVEQLRREVREMKHYEVEYLEDIDMDAELIGAAGGMNRKQLKELSDMAKKFVGN